MIRSRLILDTYIYAAAAKLNWGTGNKILAQENNKYILASPQANNP